MHSYVVERLVLFQPDIAELLPALVVQRLQEDHISLGQSLEYFCQGTARPLGMLPAKMVHLATGDREERDQQAWKDSSLARHLLTRTLTEIGLHLGSFPIRALPTPKHMCHFGFLYDVESYFRPDFRQKLLGIPVEAKTALLKGYLELIANPSSHCPEASLHGKLRSKYDQALLTLLPALVACVAHLPGGGESRELAYSFMDVVATDPPSTSVHADLGLWLQRLALQGLSSYFPPESMIRLFASLRSTLASYTCTSCGIEPKLALQTAQRIVDVLHKEKKLKKMSIVLQDLKATCPDLTKRLDIPTEAHGCLV